MPATDMGTLGGFPRPLTKEPAGQSPPGSHATSPAADGRDGPGLLVPRRPYADTSMALVAGDLGAPRRRRGWHVLGLCTGLVLLPRTAALLGRLLGFRRRVTLRLDPPFVRLETRVLFLGSAVTEHDARLHVPRLAGVAVSRLQPSLLLLVGGLAGIVLALGGIWAFVDGVLVKTTSLMLGGAGVILCGLGVDVAAFALGRLVRARRGAEVALLGTEGPVVTVSGVDPAQAQRFADAVSAALAAPPSPSATPAAVAPDR